MTSRPGGGRPVGSAVAFVMLAAVLPGIILVSAAARTGSTVDVHGPAVRGVHPVTAKPAKPRDTTTPYAPHAAFPHAASGVATLTANTQKHVAGTPVWAVASSRSRLAVTVLDHRQAAAAGIDGVLFTADLDQGSARIGMDYQAFSGAYGGNYGSRLRLVELPSCALTTPSAPGCRAVTALPSTNDARRQTVSAPISSAGTMVLAATASDPSGDGGAAGSYGPTSLKPSGSWSAGGSSGSFTYAYPIPVPSAPSSLVPTVGLSYDSGSVDGQTAATQAQSSWVGDGWATPESFIEQSFASCKDSPEGSAAPRATNDSCYDGPILTLSLNGSTTAIVRDASTGTYRAAEENDDLIQHITGSSNGSGTYNTDYWQVTDRTGTVYLFGRNELPGWTSGKQATNSVDSMPVFSAHSGDPCYKSTWADSYCTMASRWNLDYVKDVHGNAMAYYYKQDTNAYLRNADPSYTSTPNANATYVRDSHLYHIDYGFTDGNAYTAPAPDQVYFDTDGRCSAGGTCPTLTKDNASSFPDVPYDLHCDDGKACLVASASHWSTVRLKSIRTQQWNGTQYLPVDSWALTQRMPTPADGTSPTLWLDSVQHTGSDTTAGGPAVTLPAVTFTPQPLNNRVDTTNYPGLSRMRISTVTTETGAVIGVNYALVNSCDPKSLPTPASNTTSCYPVYWTPPYATQSLDWFNKYQVTSVTQADLTGASPTMYTGYAYLGGGAWHLDDNEVVKAKYRTYGQWRGFGRVRTFTGQGNDAQTEAEDTFYRGMGGTLTDSQGGAHTDANELAGQSLESTTYNFSGGPVTGSTIKSYWVSPAVATRTRTGLPDLTAKAVGEVESWARTALTSSGTTTWRVTETDTSYDTNTASATFGLPLTQFSHGDLADSTQQRCSVTTYAPANTALHLAGLPAEVEIDAVACGGSNPSGASAPSTNQTNALTAPAAVNRPAQVVSDQRAYYDNAALAATWPQAASPTWPQAAPTKGDLSEIRIATGYSGSAFTYQVREAATYDSVGRRTASYDALGRVTGTAYTTNAAGLVTGTTVTNPLGQAASSTVDPLRNLTLTVTDINTAAANKANNTSAVTTTMRYDGLGRTVAVWDHERSTGLPADVLYSYRVSNSDPTAVTTQLLNHSQTYNTSVSLFDALLRLRQRQDSSPVTGRVISDTFYDTRGWMCKINAAWWDPAAGPSTTLVTAADNTIPNQTVTAFDGAGRPVLATSYEDATVRSATATAYYGDRTVTVPLGADLKPFAGGMATATVTDALGRTSERDAYTTLPTVTASGGTVTIGGGVYRATTYTYDAVSRQADVKDVGTGEHWITGYDMLGRATSKTDPDAGTTTTVYDAAGNISQATDARGRTVSYTYDALNRKTGQYAAGALVASWVYDNANNAVANMAYPLGHVTTSTAYLGGNAYTTQASGFNAFGASVGETVNVPDSEGALAGSYTYGHRYTTDTGVLLQDSYPAAGGLPAENVVHGWGTRNTVDVAVALTGAAKYVLDVEYTGLNQVATQQLGTSPSTAANVVNTYDPHTGLLKDTQLTHPSTSQTPIDETSYAYDPAGNPTRQTDVRQGATTDTQCYAYDTLDRLSQAWTATDLCAAAPTASNVGSGTTPYWTSWGFDALGRRLSQTDHGLSGAADRTTTYTYDTAQPDTLAGASDGSSYRYDASGNTTQRTTAAHGTQTLTWSDTGQLSGITGGTGGDSSYVYDANGNLLLQKDPGKTILYLPGQQLTLDTTTKSVTGTRIIDLPGGGQVVRTGSGYGYEFADQHGTGTLTIDPTFTNPVWRQLTPYGASRGPAPASWPDNRAFLDQPADTNTGLTAVGARWYDPDTGRFASVDPILDTSNSQQLNGYTYAGANPITFSDPTGTSYDYTQWEYHGWSYCELYTCSYTAHAPTYHPYHPPTRRSSYSGGSSSSSSHGSPICDPRHCATLRKVIRQAIIAAGGHLNKDGTWTGGPDYVVYEMDETRTVRVKLGTKVVPGKTLVYSEWQAIPCGDGDPLAICLEQVQKTFRKPDRVVPVYGEVSRTLVTAITITRDGSTFYGAGVGKGKSYSDSGEITRSLRVGTLHTAHRPSNDDIDNFNTGFAASAETSIAGFTYAGVKSLPNGLWAAEKGWTTERGPELSVSFTYSLPGPKLPF